MPKGTVLWFNSEKGYGYIKAIDGSQIFVRESAIQTEGLRILDTNQKVSFEIDTESDLRGPQATKVCIIS
ncbi:MAG: cold-shock protein [Actinomycetes bacterium]|jgi:CspA family cold shock protein